MKKIISFVCLFTSLSLFAQEKLNYIDFDDVKTEFNNQLKEKNYEKVLEALNKINKNDSAYYAGLVSKVYYLKELEKYEEAIKVADEGLAHENVDSKSTFLNQQALSYIALKDYKNAMKVLDDGLKEFPMYYLFYVNKGVAYEGLKEYAKAASMYQQAIIINPYYANAHFRLGYICYQYQKTTLALMCFNTYMLLNPDGSNSLTMLEAFNKTVSAKYTEEKLPGKNVLGDNDAFEEIDLIINNQAALNKKYKTGNKIDYSLAKQNHALLALLKDYTPENDNFWDTRYVPLYKWIQENNQYDNFIYTISFSVENASYKAIVAKKTQNIKSFLIEFYTKWIDIISKNKEEFEGKNQIVKYAYYNSLLDAKGLTKNDKKIGNWYVYDKNGKLSSKVKFNDEGEKDGLWIYYDNKGNVTSEENYKNGKLDGVFTSYHENNKKQLIANYLEGKVTGTYKKFNKPGALIEQGTLNDGKLDGDYLTFYRLGENFPDYNKVPYKMGVVEGLLSEFWENGQLYTSIMFKDDKRQGEQIKYYDDGKIMSKTNYVNNLETGAFVSYHRNGTIKEEGKIENGLNEGEWKTYYDNGKMETVFNYIKGKFDGAYKKFDREDKLISEFIYKKGDIIAYKYYNQDGSVLKEAKKQKGEFYYEGYNRLGYKIAEGLYDVNGGKKGEWKFYNENGNLSSKSTYEDGKVIGEAVDYFGNGNLKKKSFYENDTIKGYYVSYYVTGNIYQQGTYKNGELNGVWLSYYKDTTISVKNFYHKGKLHGEQEYYAANGKLSYISTYEYDVLKSQRFFNSKGEEKYKIDYTVFDDEPYQLVSYNYNKTVENSVTYLYNVKHGKFTSHNYEGKLVITGNYFNGDEDGEWIYYHDNGKIKKKGSYAKGKKHGLWEEFHENGKLSDKEIYYYGKLNGISEDYNDKGILTNTYNYVDGMLQGPRTFYSEDGKIQLFRYYKDDILIGYSYLGKDGKEIPIIEIKNETGKIVTYFDNGKVSREMEYINGNLINAYKEYYYTGQLAEEQSFVDGFKNGKYTIYYPNGKVKAIHNYNMGDLHGVSKLFYEDGTLKEEITYINNDQNGENKYYNKLGKLTSIEVYFDDEIETKTIY